MIERKRLGFACFPSLPELTLADVMPVTHRVVLFLGSLAGASGGALESLRPDVCFDLGLVTWEVRGGP